MSNHCDAVGRDYDDVDLGSYWRGSRSYKKTLINIADRRVKLSHSDTVGNFSNCIINEIDNKKYEDIFNQSINSFKESLKVDKRYLSEYEYIISYFDEEKEIEQKAIKYKCLEIIYNRQKKSTQQSMDLKVKLSVDNSQPSTLSCVAASSNALSILCWWPVSKLSNPMTFWLRIRSFSKRLEPMKPATPVTSHVYWLAFRCS